MEPTRIAKIMAARGMCSRREAEALILGGQVRVDGVVVADPATRIDPASEITLDESAQRALRGKNTILYHKPVGVVSCQPEKGYTPAIAMITARNQYRRDDGPRAADLGVLREYAVAGRLDIDSHGLLVLTQDGRIARMLIGEESSVDKEYLVRYSGLLTPDKLALLNHGLHLDGRALKPARVVEQNEGQLNFTLHEGRHRQIRRMCELVGLKVVELKRVRIGKVRLGDLPYGQWRFLGSDESFV